MNTFINNFEDCYRIVFMNFKHLLFLILLCCFSCAEKKTDSPSKTSKEVVEESPFPTELQKILDAHGGLSLFQTFGSLELTLAKEGQSKSFKTNLKTDKTLIEGSDFTLGYDGKGNWTNDNTTAFNEFLYASSFKELYSATMPFLVVEDGDFYTVRLDELLFRVNYGVIHIGFGRRSGKSPDDEYVIYYDKETHQIAWLGYRVVEKGRYTRRYWQFVNYTSFQNINGLLLPKKWTLYEAKGNRPSNKQFSVEVTEYNLSEEPFPASVFEAPEGSVFR
jgi:hypothetical protein